MTCTTPLAGRARLNRAVDRHVGNYQARNFMRDAMRVGDGVLCYHSSCPELGIASIDEAPSGIRPGPTQLETASPYFDPRSQPDQPRRLPIDLKKAWEHT